MIRRYLPSLAVVLLLFASPALFGWWLVSDYALVDRYDLLFLAGRMSPGMRQTLLSYLQDVPGNTLEGRRRRVKDALYLIVNSPEYVVQK